MTDNEIIKSMQCVIGKEMLCSECTYQKVLPFPSCRMTCAKNALDLINRQNEEIESLKDELHRAKVEISKFYEQADAYCNEAIDVFADSLKIKLNRMIDILVKEMIVKL